MTKKISFSMAMVFGLFLGTTYAADGTIFPLNARAPAGCSVSCTDGSKCTCDKEANCECFCVDQPLPGHPKAHCGGSSSG